MVSWIPGWHQQDNVWYQWVISKVKSWRETDGCSFFITCATQYGRLHTLHCEPVTYCWSLWYPVTPFRMRETPGQYLHTIFCSELSGEHQVQGEESDEISPRVIISCKRSFIIEWQLRYCIRVARGRWEFENWDWLKSGHQPPSPTKNTNQLRNSLNVILAFTNLSTFWSRILWESAEAENQSRKILCIDIICIRPA